MAYGPQLLNPAGAYPVVQGDNAKGIEIDFPAGSDITGATVVLELTDWETGAPVAGWTGSVMSVNVTVLSATNPCRVQWMWPQPFTPVLPISLFKFQFVATFSSGRQLHSDYLQIQAVLP